MRTANRMLAIVLPLGCALGCLYGFERDESFTPGEVRGAAVRNDSDAKPAPFARLSLPGSARLAVADKGGEFSVKGLGLGAVYLRIVEDPDADGWPDRGGHAAAFLAKSAFDDSKTGFVLLGNVGLDGAMTITGTVRVDDGSALGVAPSDAGLVGRAYATRGQCFVVDATSYAAPKSADCVQVSKTELAARLETGAEAETSVDTTGAYELTNVISGEAEVAVILFEVGAQGLGVLHDVLGPFPAPGTAGATVVVDAITFPGVPPPQGTRRVQLALNVSVGDGAYAFVTRAGSPIPACADDPPAGVSVVATELGGDEPLVEVAWGVWDLTVCDGKASGTTLAQLALPAPDDALPPRWPVLLSTKELCVAGGKTDCDSDGDEQIPPDSRTACVDACGLAVFDQGAVPSCQIGGRTLDCDDDADGQPDTTEDIACVGPGRGTDLDGDALCTPVDPFPQCNANTAAACPAGTNDTELAAEPPCEDPQQVAGDLVCAIDGVGTCTGLRLECYLDGDCICFDGADEVNRFPSNDACASFDDCGFAPR